MPRSGEYTYMQQIGEAGREHAVNKPFSDDQTPRFFADMAVIFSLLPKPPARVLDCGCGTGWLSWFLARKGYEVVGQDCCEDAVDLARENPLFVKDVTPVEFIASDFETLDYDEEFDAIVFYASLHHSLDPEKAIHSTWRALRPDGIFVALEPGKGHGDLADDHAAQYDLGDRDMPPTLIVKLGKAAGFRKAKVYQHAGQLMSTLYNEEPNSPLKRRLFQIPGVKLAALLASALWFKRDNGTVWMQK